ncbi:hypothetical protein B7463_g12101, partial [Scytalidium lignicola]
MASENAPLVHLPQGAFRGESRGGVNIFRGLPYARSTRFGAPTAAAFHEGVRPAVVRGPICPQNPSRLTMIMGPIPSEHPMSEDCQNVSIFSPNLAGHRAVMVWFHGGAYVSGGGDISWYDADKLAIEGDVVVVTVTYRLGAFGFLCPPEGKGVINAGLLDQIAALEWVQKNIDHFGGDSDNITLFGQSAGGHAIVQLLDLVPSLFHRAIIQSAPFAIQNTKSQAQEVYQSFTDALGVDPIAATVEQILQAQGVVMSTSSLHLPFSPVVSNTCKTSPHTERTHNILMGWTKHDSGPFIIMRRGNNPNGYGSILDRILTVIMTSLHFARPARRFASCLQNAGGVAGFYTISWCPQGSNFGAPHCIELPLLLGDQQAWQQSPMLGRALWAEVEERGRNIRLAWAAFARDGELPAKQGVYNIV